MDASKWNDQLSDEQVLAASHTGSHARLLAGPGTGKTHTLARRVVYLVAEKGVDPSTILALTFTRLTARQMKMAMRLQLSPFSADVPYIATLHGFALRQLMKNAQLLHSIPRPLRIADQWEQEEIVARDLQHILGEDLRTIRKRFLALASDWQTLRADNGEREEGTPDARFTGAWSDHRRVYGYTLLDELIYQLKRALEQVPGFTLEPKFKHVLIDEYQDLNPCDLAIASALAKQMELMACGDDDQSIYGFRHADPTGIRSFISDFPGSTNLTLTECRRCDEEILHPAIWVAKQDTRRIPKKLESIPGHTGGDVKVLGFTTGDNEAKGVAILCKYLISVKKIDPGKIMVLLRSNRNKAYSKPLCAYFNQLEIPYEEEDNSRSVLDLGPGRNLLSILRLIANPEDHLSWRTRLTLARGIGLRSIDPIYNFATNEACSFSSALKRLDEYSLDMRSNVATMIRGVVTSTNEIIEEMASEVPEEDQDISAFVRFVEKVAERVIAEEDDRLKVMAFIQGLAETMRRPTLDDFFAVLVTAFEDQENEPGVARVSILTMHQAKGLTADSVIIMGAEDQVLPRSEQRAELDDDRRLLYVSMTRAQHRMYITYAGQRTNPQNQSGRTPGSSYRTLTRFLTNSSLKPLPGEDFIADRIKDIEEGRDRLG